MKTLFYGNNFWCMVLCVSSVIHFTDWILFVLGEKRDRDRDQESDEEDDFGPNPMVQPKDYAADKQVIILSTKNISADWYLWLLLLHYYCIFFFRFSLSVYFFCLIFFAPAPAHFFSLSRPRPRPLSCDCNCRHLLPQLPSF